MPDRITVTFCAFRLSPAVLRRLARTILAVYAAWWLALAGVSLFTHNAADDAPHVRMDGQEWVVVTHHAETGGPDRFDDPAPAAAHALHHELSLKLDGSRLQLLLALALPLLAVALLLVLPFLAATVSPPRPGGFRFPLRNHPTALIATLRLQV